MCKRITCAQCGLATWTGCGNHVEEALRGVPADRRCPGHDDEQPRAGWRDLFRLGRG